MCQHSFSTAAKAGVLLVLLLSGGVLLTGCSKPPEELPVNARVTDDGKPAPPESATAPAAPGMDIGGKGKKGP